MKKFLAIFALACLALVETVIYWNAHLYYRAKELLTDPVAKAGMLESAARLYPWNDLVYFELGRVYFDQGAEALGNAALRDGAFGNSLRSFLKALRLNPGSAATHFHLAQSLQYMSFLAVPTPISYFDEYKKAASLTGHNSQIYYEVGKVLFSRWESLWPAEREFTLDILARTLAGRDLEKLQAILEVWYLHAQDYAVIERVLPDDAGMRRDYAQFLGEKSLSLDARERALAKAEALDFVRAKNDLEVGERQYDYFQGEEASGRLSSCLKVLQSLRFYQDLTRQALIDPQEYARVRKTVLLLMAKNEIDQTRSLADPNGSIETYLAAEDQVTAVGEFENFLRERGFFENESGGARSKDLRVLALRLAMDFKQNRYRDITKSAGFLEESTLIIPEAGRPHYIHILQLIGDSFLKLDYIYEAEKYYRKALEISPENLESLLRILKCYERLNDDVKAREIRRTLDGILTPGEIDLGSRRLEKGDACTVPLVCEGRPLSFRVEIAARPPGSNPLVTAVFNDRVVWEGYLEAGALSFSAVPGAGANNLVLTAVNQPVSLLKIKLSPQTAR